MPATLVTVVRNVSQRRLTDSTTSSLCSSGIAADSRAAHPPPEGYSATFQESLECMERMPRTGRPSPVSIQQESGLRFFSKPLSPSWVKNDGWRYPGNLSVRSGSPMSRRTGQ